MGVHGMVRHLLAWLLKLGVFGPLLLGIADSSFLFLPFGNDLLVVILVARNHAPFALPCSGRSHWLHARSSASGCRVPQGRRRGTEENDEAPAPGIFQTTHEQPGCDRDWAGLSRPAAISLHPCHRERQRLRLSPPAAARLGLRNPRRPLHDCWPAGHPIRARHPEDCQAPETTWIMLGFIVLCVIGSAFQVMQWVRRSRRSGSGSRTGSAKLNVVVPLARP